MANDLAIYERAMEPMLPAFRELLAPIGLPAERLIRTALISIERIPALTRCTMQSIISSTMSAATLGLEIDGVSGQGYLLPFADTCQFIVGARGFPTIADRSGWTMRANVVREGDEFDYDLGGKPFVHHKKDEKGALDAPIRLFYSLSTSPGGLLIPEVMTVAEVNAIMAKSPAVKKGRPTPWKDPQGYAEMGKKTVLRRNSKFVPVVGVQRAAAFDQAHEELGKLVQLRPDGNIIEAEATVVGAGETKTLEGRLEKPKFDIVLGEGPQQRTETRDDINDWLARWLSPPRGIVPFLKAQAAFAALKVYRENNGAVMKALFDAGFKPEVMQVQREICVALGEPFNEEAYQ